MEVLNTNLQLIEQLEALVDSTKSQDLIQLLKLGIEADKKHLELLTDSLTDGFAHCQIIHDNKGRPVDYKFLSANKAYKKQIGIKTKDIIGKTALELYSNVEKSWIDIYARVTQSGKPHSFVNFNHDTNKQYRTNIFSSSKGYFSLLFSDVTESLALTTANLEIVKSYKLNTDVLENMQEAFLHCEIICNDHNIPIDYKFLYVNKAFESQTGIKIKDILGKTVLELFPDVERSWIETFGEVAMSSKPASFVRFNHNTNKYYQTSAFSPSEGQFAVFLHDVTDQEVKRLELEEAYKKAEENEKLKSAFLANMSHEIRTPMNAILGFTSILEDDAVSPEDKKACLKHIKSSGSRLLTIISDIIDISKIEAQQQKLVHANCNLNQLLDQLYAQYLVLNSNLAISFKIEKGLKNDDCYIITDETRLNQILSNLIDNALKYTLKGEITFGYSLKKRFLEFYIKDTGIGIRKEDQKIIFERFRQIENKSIKVATGTGLGMSIAKGLVTLFDGDIWVESEPEKGSCFYFTIPYTPAKFEEPDEYQYTILIAEDDDVNFLLLDLWLNRQFNIVRATNGYEAVQFFQKNSSIDLIIMDIRMPYMDGIEATKEIRKTNTHIPIIAHTAYAMNEESISIRKAGCNQVLIKPITRDILLSVLTKYKIEA